MHVKTETVVKNLDDEYSGPDDDTTATSEHYLDLVSKQVWQVRK